MDQSPPLLRWPLLRVADTLVVLSAAVIVLMAGQPAIGGELETQLDCPRNVQVGGSVLLNLRFDSSSCNVQNVRVLSTIVGNGNETTSGVGILGPEVAAANVAVAAAIDLLPGSCVSNRCTGSTLFCGSDVDCVCVSIEPVTTEITLAVPTLIPAAFDGTVINQFVFTDQLDGTGMIGDTCLIAVPEPGSVLQGAVGLATVLTLIRLRRNRAGHP